MKHEDIAAKRIEQQPCGINAAGEGIVSRCRLEAEHRDAVVDHTVGAVVVIVIVRGRS